MKRRKQGLRSILGLLAFVALGVAIAQELRKPSGERTWHGQVFGLVPYDLRPPTFERIKAAWWNPEDPHLITRQPFGVGWTINVYRLVAPLESGT